MLTNAKHPWYILKEKGERRERVRHRFEIFRFVFELVTIAGLFAGFYLSYQGLKLSRDTANYAAKIFELEHMAVLQLDFDSTARVRIGEGITLYTTLRNLTDIPVQIESQVIATDIASIAFDTNKVHNAPRYPKGDTYLTSLTPYPIPVETAPITKEDLTDILASKQNLYLMLQIDYKNLMTNKRYRYIYMGDGVYSAKYGLNLTMRINRIDLLQDSLSKNEPL